MSSSSRTLHLDQQQLAAFAQGQLADADRKMLQAHLDQCPACRQQLGKLRGAAESHSGQSTLNTTGAVPEPMSYHSGASLLADLANHPRYEILQLLGQGGMGAVYKARHKVMDRLVALKIISASLLDNAKAVERFHREVRAAACHFIRQAALGLEHAHEHGMVHRDIKPHNLMLTAGGIVKVTDFGLARLARETASQGGFTGDNVLMGTADYIAPEQAQDAHRADIRADIYSLGCSLFHLLAGKPPFTGSMVQKIAGHLTGTIHTRLAELPATIPEALRSVLAKMLEKDAADRYQTPAEAAQALAPFLKKGGAKPAEARPVESVSAGPGSDATASLESPPAAASATDLEQAKRLVRKPAIALLVMGCLGLFVHLAAAIGGATRPATPIYDVSTVLGLVAVSIAQQQAPATPKYDVDREKNSELDKRLRRMEDEDKPPATPKYDVNREKNSELDRRLRRMEDADATMKRIVASLGFFCSLTSALAIWGASNMMRLRNYRLSMAGSYAVMVGFFLLLTIPVGIWSVMVLRKPEVRSAFR